MTRGVRERSAMLVAGSRTSQLARAQTASVISLLQQANPHLQFDLRLYSTRGDRELDAPLPTIGGKGLFTEQLEKALRDGEIDFAVHSLKDLPVDDAYGLVTAAILARSDPSDVLVTRDGTTLSELPQGAVIGTSSLRRQAQLLAQRPDLRARSIRGNVETRIRKVEDGEYDGVVLASAGIARLGLSGISMTHFSPEAMLPAPGQGALAVQCRSDDERTLSLLRAIDDAGLRAAVTAERTFLSHLGAGCSAPVAALAGVESDNGPVSLRGRVLSVDGSRVIDVAGTGTDPRELGTRLAKEALDRGAAGLMPPSAALPLARRRVCVTRTPE
ncbi:hydroxymethylbilane synthase, partial [Salinispira pacifica]